MSTPEYMLVARTVDGQDIELMGISVHIQELNGITLFRVPAETPDEEVYAIRDMLAEAFKDMHPERIIVARGGFELRLEKIETRPASKIDQYHWLEQKIQELQKERDQLHRELFGNDRLNDVVREWKPSQVTISRPYTHYEDTTGRPVWIRNDSEKIDLSINLTEPHLGYLVNDLIDASHKKTLRSSEKALRKAFTVDANAVQEEEKDG